MNERYTIKRPHWIRITKNRETGLGSRFVCRMDTVIGTFAILQTWADQDCTIPGDYFCRITPGKTLSDKSLVYLKRRVEDFYVESLMPALEVCL